MKNIFTLLFAVAFPAVVFANSVPGNMSAASAGSSSTGSQAPSMGTSVEGPEGVRYSTTDGISAENNIPSADADVRTEGNDVLAINVQKALAANGEVAESLNNVLITNEGGHIILTGTVNSHTERKQLTDAVEKIPGVTSVDNQLEVKL